MERREEAWVLTRSLAEEPLPEDGAVPHAGPATPQLGDVLDDHLQIHGVLGSGGMGTVYLAHDERLDRRVAVKLLHADRVSDKSMLAGFVEEARAMARVHHPNVVTIHAWGEHDGSPYIVMEYVRGDDLARWQRQRGTIAPTRAVAVTEAICQGVQAIHDVAAAHRDLKPSNVLMGPGERVVVSDFGLARPVTHLPKGGHSGLVTGTPAYLAPEVARDEPLDPDLASRVDVYALGVIAFELLTGRWPFLADSLVDLLRQHGHVPPPAPSTIRTDLPEALDEPILRALAKDPAERTDSPETLRRELVAALEGRRVEAQPRRILLVDDDIGALQAIQEVLRMHWPETDVITVADVGAAIELAKRHRPDVIVTDLHMPDGGGTRLTQTIRALPETRTIPIVVVTGYGGGPDWQNLMAKGANSFLVKPLDVDALIAVIGSLIARARQ